MVKARNLNSQLIVARANIFINVTGISIALSIFPKEYSLLPF